jgi:FdhD protein
MRDIMGENQQLFKKTGGVHAVARFSSNGTLVDIAEDVGRHNAMDRIVGRAFLAGSLPLSDEVVVLSGRISYEMVEKAVRAGVAVLAAVGAATTLAVDVARAHGMTLVSFISDERCNICSAAHRIIGDAD